MQTRIGHFCLIVDFLDVDFSSNQISDILKIEVDDILANLTLKNLDDWTLRFRATYTNARQPLVSKNRFGSYRSDKIKEITIIIPIPIVESVSWGVNVNQHIYDTSHYDRLINNFHSFEIDFKNLSNRTDYILNCMRMGIKLSFTHGLTVNKEKIRVNKII